MKLSQFKFKLPEEQIALHPTTHRDESRLMVVHKKSGLIEHRMFKDIFMGIIIIINFKVLGQHILTVAELGLKTLSHNIILIAQSLTTKISC